MSELIAEDYEELVALCAKNKLDWFQQHPYLEVKLALFYSFTFIQNKDPAIS